MKNNHNFLNAVSNAFNGMKQFFLHEPNAQIQLVIAVITIVSSAWLSISAVEWMVVLICIGMVIGLEMLNLAIENLCNLVQEEYHPAIKIIKDVAAAAVLWVSLISIVVGIIIFLPKIISLI